MHSCRLLALATLLVMVLLAPLRSTAAPAADPDRPRLVVGIVVDQMRAEYLDRFEARFGAGGFRRLTQDGFNLRNTHYNYVPTVTAPGHATIYTGASPSTHGIVGNDIYDRKERKKVGVVEDSSVRPVGSSKGGASPQRLRATTITDELKRAVKKSKVISVSIKDRGAILPAGHIADAAYWFEGDSARFITSTWYRPSLPRWLERFNARNLPDAYLTLGWNTLYPIETYVRSNPDASPYEDRKPAGLFPYSREVIMGTNGLSAVTGTPHGNTLIKELALTALHAERLGADEHTDFLAISFSSTDSIGHAFGPNSVEVEDAYLRLDRDLADLFADLDRTVGRGGYLCFLTSDHGVVDVPQELVDSHLPAGYIKGPDKKDLNKALAAEFGATNWVEEIHYAQIFLNHGLLTNRAAADQFPRVIDWLQRDLAARDGVAWVFTRRQLLDGRQDEPGVKGMFIRGHHPERSGDLAFALHPGWLDSTSRKGTTHGTGYPYDTHVPLLWYGWQMPRGQSTRRTAIQDIAPTLSFLLRVQLPSGATGTPIPELTR